MRSRLDIVLDVLHRGLEAALATVSGSMPGFPFVTSAPYALDEHHRPLFLLSALAEHTRNIAADRRCSVLVRGPGSGGDAPRITLVGEMLPFAASPRHVGRFLRYQPEAERYLQLGDFSFYRMEIARIRIIGGFGQAGWLDGERLLELPWLDPLDEEAALATVAAAAPTGLRVLGVDPAGVDVVSADARIRIALEGPFDSGNELAGRVAAAIAALRD